MKNRGHGGGWAPRQRAERAGSLTRALPRRRGWSCGSAGLGRRVSAARFSYPQGSGGRSSAGAPQVRVLGRSRLGRRPGAAVAGGFRDGGGSRGDERRSECGDLGDAAGTGSSGAPSALGWGWVAAQTVRGSLGSREGALPVSREPVCWHRAVPGRGDHFWRSRALGGRSIQFSQVPRAREALGAGRGLLGIPEVKQGGVRVPETSVCLRSPWGDRAMPLSLPGRNRLGGCGWGRERARGDQRLYWGFCFAQRGAVTVRHGPQSFFGAIGRRISSCGRGSAGSESPGVRDLGSGTTPQHCLWFSVSNGFDPVPFL